MVKKRIHLIYGIVLSIATIVAGICVCIACMNISATGSHPFSVEVIAAAFSRICVPVYVFLGLVAGGFFLDLVLPKEAETLRPHRQYALTLARLRNRVDLFACDKKIVKKLRSYRIKRKILRIFSMVVIIICLTYFLSYGLNGYNFHETEITISMMHAGALLVPCLSIPSFVTIIAAYYERHSMRMEIELLKKAIAAGCQKEDVPADPPRKVPGRWIYGVRYVLLAVGLGVLLYGFFAGGTADVLTKAANICNECIGLG